MYIFFINFQIKISFLSIFLTQSRFFIDFRLFGQSTLKGLLSISEVRKFSLLHFLALQQSTLLIAFLHILTDISA